VHIIEADIEYLLVNKGDWIQYAGDIALTGAVQGRIKGIIWADGVCVGIDTDEPVVMTEGKQHAVRIRLQDGTIILKEVVFNSGIRREKSVTYYPGDDEELYEPFIGEMYAVDEDNVSYEAQNMILFTSPLEENAAPKAGDIYAFGERGYEVIDLIIVDIQPGQNFTATLSCVEYSPEIFGVDDPDFVLPDFVNRISPVSGAVDSGVVNSNKWRNFVVYHDSETAPQRPTGDGTTDGWYNSQTFRSIWQSTKIAESVESGEWGQPVRIKAARGIDDITPIWLGLSPQNITLETDGDGNILAGLLPLNIQARLFQWNSVLSGVLFSLSNAPTGISINSSGLITVNANANLGENSIITVNATYQSITYTAILTIKKNIRNSPARYLGTIMSFVTLGNSTVTIVKGPVMGQVRAWQGDYILTIAAIGGRPAGSVFQWTGIDWQFRSPDTHADLYIRCFKDGLDSPNLTNNVEWFGAVFTRLIVAQRAYIEALESMLIQVNGAIFGGERFVKENGQVIDRGSDRTGFCIAQNGILKASGVEISGDIHANNGTFRGDLFSGVLFSSNQLNGENMPSKTFHSSDTAKTVWDFYGGNSQNIPVNSGSWGGVSGIFGLNLSFDRIPVPGNVGLGGVATRYILDILIFNGTTIRRTWADANGHRNILGAALIIDGGRRGPVFRLNLPLGADGLNIGDVYRDSAGFVRIKF
jgi:hypothetical protein